MDAEMLARELDPVGQSRYEMHFRTRVGTRDPKCPCLVHPVLISHSAISAFKEE